MRGAAEEMSRVDINVDMVGRSNGSLQAISHNSEELFEKVRAFGAERGLEVKPDQQPSWKISYQTDSYHFMRFDVPAVEFFTGIHPDYHQPSDEADKIRYHEMVRIVDLIGTLADEYAPRPAARRPKWFLTPQ
jgi:Zn-dependent M28 family amino/carboxypeptidase